MMENQTAVVATDVDLGANEFTFTGDRTSITFFPSTPGPVIIGHEGGELRYEGPEGSIVVYGNDIERTESPLGTLLTIQLPSNPDAGRRAVTVVLPHAFGVERGAPVTFATIAVKTTGRGFTTRPGVAPTYTILPLVGQAAEVFLPL
jgi:hypothetical protein